MTIKFSFFREGKVLILDCGSGYIIEKSGDTEQHLVGVNEGLRSLKMGDVIELYLVPETDLVWQINRISVGSRLTNLSRG